MLLKPSRYATRVSQSRWRVDAWVTRQTGRTEAGFLGPTCTRPPIAVAAHVPRLYAAPVQ